jgi:DNA replication protein DnaC
MKEIEKIRQYADSLRLTLLKNQPESMIHEAQIDNPGYLEFTLKLLEREIKQRQKTDLERRLTLARLPKDNDLTQFDFNHSNGISKPQLKELRELLWLDQNYNLILMGPSGTGKTFIASGLIHDAVKAGYKAYFKTMEELLTILRMKEMTGSAMNAYNRLLKANVIAIDDIMLFPMKKNEAVAFFNMINHLHEKCSIIVTTNKSPKQWAETLDDEVLATALLDRLLYRCEVIKLDGNSYRMENRKTIFNQ